MTSSVFVRWSVRHRLVVFSALTTLLLMVTAAPASATEGKVLVYDNQTALDPGFTSFGAATGHSVTTLESLPSGLGGYDCVLLNLNQVPFTNGQIASLFELCDRRRNDHRRR